MSSNIAPTGSLPETTLWKPTLKLWKFGFFQVPMLYYCGPRILKLDVDQCVVRINLNRRTKNHLSSMYFGALAVGVDCTAGMFAMYHIEQAQCRMSVIFKDFQAEFLRRAETTVDFVCEGGTALAEGILAAKQSGERGATTLDVTAFLANKTRQDKVAQFKITVSYKSTRR